MVFDVNDFDEAYIGHFSWDLRRFVASLALMGWQKALPEDDVARPDRQATCAPTSRRSSHYASTDEDDDFALHLDNTDGPVHDVLARGPRPRTRVDLLDGMTAVEDDVRVFADDAAGPRGSATPSARKVVKAFERYLETIPESKRLDRDLSTTCATSSASPASASAAPGCRRTTCWSRATASRSTTTWCCR